MKRVKVKLNFDAIAPSLDVIKSAADDLESRLAIDAAVPEPEQEFIDEWRGELLAGQTSDIRQLLTLFGSDFFTTGAIEIDPNSCESILRACSALRLRLREARLKLLGDEILESGEVLLDEIPEPERRVFAAYVFLATLQELIIQHLDPIILEN